MKENELMMSDVPWAVAWYGQRQCVWLTLNAQDDFFAINDNLKAVQALYLTPLTTDGKFLSDWVLQRSQLGQFRHPGSVAKSNSEGVPAPKRADRLPARTPVPHGPGTLENRTIDLRRCPPQPVGNARPLRRFRRRFDNNQVRARLVATVQLRVNRTRKRLRVMRNHTHPRKIFAGGNVRVSDDVAIQKLRVES